VCDVGRREGPGDEFVADHVERTGGVRGPDADLGGLGNDKGVLVADVGRILGRRDEKVVVRGVLNAHVGHVGVVWTCLGGRLNPQPDLAGVGRWRHHPRNVAENLEGNLGA